MFRDTTTHFSLREQLRKEIRGRFLQPRRDSISFPNSKQFRRDNARKLSVCLIVISPRSRISISFAISQFERVISPGLIDGTREIRRSYRSYLDGTVIETVICRKKFGKKGKERKAEVEKKSNLRRFFLDDLENSRMGGGEERNGRKDPGEFIRGSNDRNVRHPTKIIPPSAFAVLNWHGETRERAWNKYLPRNVRPVSAGHVQNNGGEKTEKNVHTGYVYEAAASCDSSLRGIMRDTRLVTRLQTS